MKLYPHEADAKFLFHFGESLNDTLQIRLRMGGGNLRPDEGLALGHNGARESDARLSRPDPYWRWSERNFAGNAIDFFMRVLGLWVSTRT